MDVYKFINKGIADLTSIMSGTGASFKFEVETVWVDSVSTAFTWSAGALDIPTYTTGTVKVQFILYLKTGEPSKHDTKDPTNPASDVVFWEERITSFPTISSSISSFESGEVKFKASNIAFTALNSGWDILFDSVEFVGTTIEYYKNNALVYQGITGGSTVSRGVITTILKNLNSVFDDECTFGDPDYLVRIDPDYNSTYYNAGNIPEKYYGVSIPFIIGDRMPYQDFQGQTIDSGTYIAAAPAYPALSPKVDTEALGTGWICKIIPTGATTGIVCRIPSFQALGSTVGNDAFFGVTANLWSKIRDGGSALSALPTQLAQLNYGASSSMGGRMLRNGGVIYQQSQEGQTGTAWTSADFDEELHLCSATAPNAFDPATVVISYTATPNGNRLVEITAPGCDFTANDYWLVCSNVTGSVSAPEVMEFILEQHGLTVNASSFSTLASAYPQKTCIQVGLGKGIKTLNNIVSEINRGLMTFTKIPLDGTEISMEAVDFTPTPTDTLTDENVSNLRVTMTGEGIYKNLKFEPIYAKGTIYRDDVYGNAETSESAIYNSDKTLVLNHVMTSKPTTRWDDIAEFYGKPNTNVSFILLDETTEYDVGDYLTIDHSDFKGDIIITTITRRRIGSQISGRKL